MARVQGVDEVPRASRRLRSYATRSKLIRNLPNAHHDALARLASKARITSNDLVLRIIATYLEREGAKVPLHGDDVASRIAAGLD